MSNSPYLHSIIEVPKEQSIRCEAPGCTATVWKAIHVVIMDGEIHLYGSSCFKKVFGGTVLGAANPSYSGKAGRSLSDVERLMLLENRRRLLELLEEEHREEIDRQAKLQALEDERREQEEKELDRVLSNQNIAPTPARSKPDAETKARILSEAKNRFRQNHPGCDPDQPGWIGMVWVYEAEILKELGYSR